MDKVFFYTNLKNHGKRRSLSLERSLERPRSWDVPAWFWVFENGRRAHQRESRRNSKISQSSKSIGKELEGKLKEFSIEAS